MRTLLFVIFLGISISVSSQSSFPESWKGNYDGNLEIYAVDSIAMNLRMKLDIIQTEKDSIFKWVITYDFKGKEDIRSYELKVIDKQKGLYQIDEKNSIVIDAYYKNGIFTSFFSVNKVFIIATYTMNKEKAIIFEIISAKTKEISTTGGTKNEEEEIPTVNSYLVNGRHRAVLISK